MVLNRQRDRERKALTRRKDKVPVRRLGKNALSGKQRYAKWSLANFPDVKPEFPEGVVVEAGSLSQFNAVRLKIFLDWRKHAETRKVDFSQNPDVAASSAVAKRVTKRRVLQILLRFWRFHGASTWDKLESELVKTSPSWVKVERILRGNDGPNHGGQHRSYFLQELRGVSGADHDVVILRCWSQKKADNIMLRRAADTPLTVSNVCRALARLPGVGHLHAVEILKSLDVAKMLKSDGCGAIGPGPCAAVDFLRKSGSNTRCKGVWPWESDKKEYRAAVQALAKKVGVPFLQMQHTLCGFKQDGFRVPK